MDTATGSITIDFELYLTAIDTIRDSIQVIINRDCAEDRIYADAFILYACAIGCEDLFTGKPCAWIDRCNYWGHQYSQWRAVYQTWGKGSLSVWYGRTLILYVEFNFLDPGGYGEPNFVGISFKNKDFSTITPGDVFDAYESIGIVADVGWELRVAPAIQIKLIAGMAEMMVEAPLYQSNGHEGIYRVLLPAWALSSLVGSGYNSPGFRERLRPSLCLSPAILTVKYPKIISPL